MEKMKRRIRKAMVKEKVLRLLLVDDHAVVRKGLGLGLLLGMDGRFEVVAEVERGDEALAAYEEHGPDVVLMDVRMPGKGGVEATAGIRKKFPEAKVLMLTSYDLDEDVFRALDAGAAGYLLKTVAHEELFEAILCVHGGGRYLPGDLAERVEARNPRAQLSPRELETLELLAKGFTNKEIGMALGVTERTGKAMRRRYCPSWKWRTGRRRWTRPTSGVCCGFEVCRKVWLHPAAGPRWVGAF